tara:strand:+ start:128 stop:328 length:201 start_codon:yes stop_codon:yes gene_type:complete
MRIDSLVCFVGILVESPLLFEKATAHNDQGENSKDETSATNYDESYLSFHPALKGVIWIVDLIDIS